MNYLETVRITCVRLLGISKERRIVKALADSGLVIALTYLTTGILAFKAYAIWAWGAWAQLLDDGHSCVPVSVLCNLGLGTKP